ncbi:DUF2264 domain-containing protein [Dactylosporangium aurantiacum]|uniref:DUF2264 domain-containing protein n=1 Tax=Dactylosporangium aurantiacum TaxID=35754 RepID=A0A9Q9IMA5_9ACTN|nr:DUF2264 domain-containing protein [Dactylosporangium aurantiacum]MDG6107635.1 DUF2264 domain-containing protein [Dactylosporangium aurantiacum]UWZ58769.1 DUF2264 domain-containing protein [Dactylosporangium aurantiacum]
MHMQLPPEDRTLSPITGWTRAHWEATADTLLARVVPYAAPDFAQFRLPGRASQAGVISDGLEGFARTFLLAAFRIAGADGAGMEDLLDRYRRGLVAGTDPHHPYAWPALRDMAQPLVEAASIAVALHETRPWIFDRLGQDERERVVGWLAGFVGRRTPDSNWVLFQVIVEQFLATVGGPHDPAEIEGGLERIERWYAGDGWYSDGAGQNFDHYCGWAMHLYPALWARMAGDTARAERYAERLRLFLAQYQLLFAADGAPMHQGRSLTYRFATAAPLWLGALTGGTPLPPGVTRRLASGNLRHFVDRGAPDHRGLLPLGWHGAFRPIAQAYSGPASPYWASKGFLGLLLPADHPVWTATERPAPIDERNFTAALPAPGWLVHGTRADGIVRLVNHGSDRAARQPADSGPDPNYTHLAYSTHSGPVLDTSSFDSQLVVIGPDGRRYQRRRIQRLHISDQVAVSRWADGLVRVETASVVDGPFEVRVHLLDAPAGSVVREAGHALAGASPPQLMPGGVARTDGLTSSLRSLHGFTGTGLVRATDANAFGAHAATPLLHAQHPGGTAMYVSLVGLTGAPAAEPVLVGVEGFTATIRLAGGAAITVRPGGPLQ